MILREIRKVTDIPEVAEQFKKGMRYEGDVLLIGVDDASFVDYNRVSNMVMVDSDRAKKMRKQGKKVFWTDSFGMRNVEEVRELVDFEIDTVILLLPEPTIGKVEESKIVKAWIELSLEKLKDGGMLQMVVHEDFLSQRAFSELRGELLEEHGVPLKIDIPVSRRKDSCVFILVKKGECVEVMTHVSDVLSDEYTFIPGLIKDV